MKLNSALPIKKEKKRKAGFGPSVKLDMASSIAF